MSDLSFSKLDERLDESGAAELVKAFYDASYAAEHSSYADFVGEDFVTLGKNRSDFFGAEDLIAVHMMGMTFRPTAVRGLLGDGKEHETLSRLLARIPESEDIWEASSLEAADELWMRLTSEKTIYRGIDWVTAGKLLARKRPRLIPIVDEVVVDLIPRPSFGYWELFRRYLQRPGAVEKVERLRPDGLSSGSTPTLRLFDTVIWMRGSRGRGAREVRNALGLEDLR